MNNKTKKTNNLVELLLSDDFSCLIFSSFANERNSYT